MSTILDPEDPSLGSSYLDGVERAARVKKKKKLSEPADEEAPDGTLGAFMNRLLPPHMRGRPMLGRMGDRPLPGRLHTILGG